MPQQQLGLEEQGLADTTTVPESQLQESFYSGILNLRNIRRWNMRGTEEMLPATEIRPQHGEE